MDGYINEHGKLSKPKLKNGFLIQEILDLIKMES